MIFGINSLLLIAIQFSQNSTNDIESTNKRSIFQPSELFVTGQYYRNRQDQLTIKISYVVRQHKSITVNLGNIKLLFIQVWNLQRSVILNIRRCNIATADDQVDITFPFLILITNMSNIFISFIVLSSYYSLSRVDKFLSIHSFHLYSN